MNDASKAEPWSKFLIDETKVAGGSFVAATIPIATLNFPKPGKWTVEWLNIRYTPPEGHEPNWAARWFTRWVFGVKWTRNA